MTRTLMLRATIVAALMGSAAAAWAQGAPAPGKPDKAAQTFLTKAIQGNLAEVSMGQLAQKQGESADVKSFGQQ